jgi:hypothetical protein
MIRQKQENITMTTTTNNINFYYYINPTTSLTVFAIANNMTHQVVRILNKEVLQ